MQSLTLFARKAQPGQLTHPTLELKEHPFPKAGPGECIVKVAYCGICGSDFLMAASMADGSIAYDGVCAPPVTLGHEFSGRVEVSDTFPGGSAVVAEETFGCTECVGCRTQGESNCTAPRKIGFNSDGAFASHVVVPERKCWSIEPILRRYGDEAGLRLAALVQPYAIAYSCFRSPNFPFLRKGEAAILVGAGPVGLAAVDLARVLGAREIHVIEPWIDRRLIAQRLGASAIYSHESELPTTLRGDWMLDSSGTRTLPSIVERHLENQGKLVLLSKVSGRLARPFFVKEKVELLVPDGHACPDAYPRVIELFANGELRGDPLISGVVDLHDALIRLREQVKSPGKILVKP